MIVSTSLRMFSLLPQWYHSTMTCTHTHIRCVSHHGNILIYISWLLSMYHHVYMQYTCFFHANIVYLTDYTMMMMSSQVSIYMAYMVLPLLNQVYMLTQEWYIFLNCWSAVCQKVVARDYVVCVAVRHQAWPPSRTRKANDIAQSYRASADGAFLVATLVSPLCPGRVTRTTHSRFLCVSHNDWLLSSFDFVAWNGS